MYSSGSNWQYGSIGSDIGLAPNTPQAIIRSNVDMLYWCIYASSSLNDLTHWLMWDLLEILHKCFSM